MQSYPGGIDQCVPEDGGAKTLLRNKDKAASEPSVSYSPLLVSSGAGAQLTPMGILSVPGCREY